MESEALVIRCFLLLHSEEVWARTLISSDLSGENQQEAKGVRNKRFDKGLHSVRNSKQRSAVLSRDKS